MALKKNHCPDTIEQVDRGKIDVTDYGVEKEAEMADTYHTSIDVVGGGDAVKIINIGS